MLSGVGIAGEPRSSPGCAEVGCTESLFTVLLTDFGQDDPGERACGFRFSLHDLPLTLEKERDWQRGNSIWGLDVQRVASCRLSGIQIQ